MSRILLPGKYNETTVVTQDKTKFSSLPVDLLKILTSYLRDVDIQLFSILNKNMKYRLYIWDRPVKEYDVFIRRLIIYNYLDLLIYYHKKYDKFPKDVCYWAAFRGRLAILKYLHKNNYPLDDCCSCAAYGGSLECLKYAYENGSPLNRDTCYSAANKGSLECLKYAHKNGCPLDKDILRRAAENGHLECLKYLVENGCESSKKICYEITDVECLKYLPEKGY
jgi:Ankyrin repeats (3 copies)